MQSLKKNWGATALQSGIALLVLGMVLLVLGANMSAHGTNPWILAVASVLLCVGMAWPLLQLSRGRWPIAPWSVLGLLLAAGVFFLAYKAAPVTTWITMPTGGLGVANPVVLWITMPAGGMGILWSLWLLRLAMPEQRQRGKARLLAIAAGVTATLGVVLAMQTDLSRITALTAAACFAFWIGAQVLMSIPLLYRELCTEMAQTVQR